MASISLGSFFGYENNNYTYGYYNVSFHYSEIVRSGTTVTVKGAYVHMSNPNSGYTTNTVYVDKVTINGTDVGISGSAYGGSSYHSWSTTPKDISFTAAGNVTSVGVSAGCHRSGQSSSAQSCNGTLTIPAGESTITYNANGGSGAPSSQKKQAGVNLTLSSTVPSRANVVTTGYKVTFNANGGSCTVSSLNASNTTSYSFIHWNTASNGSGNSYNPGGVYSTDADATLYAIWSESLARGAVSLPVPTRNGYVFLGWSTSTSGNNGYTGSYTPAGNVTLYALWKQVIKVVSFKVNGSYTSGGTVNVKNTSGDWVAVDKIYIRNSSGVFEEH